MAILDVNCVEAVSESRTDVGVARIGDGVGCEVGEEVGIGEGTGVNGDGGGLGEGGKGMDRAMSASDRPELNRSPTINEQEAHNREESHGGGITAMVSAAVSNCAFQIVSKCCIARLPPSENVHSRGSESLLITDTTNWDPEAQICSLVRFISTPFERAKELDWPNTVSATANDKIRTSRLIPLSEMKFA